MLIDFFLCFLLLFLVTNYLFYINTYICQFSSVTQSVCSAGDLGLILGSGRSPGEGNGCPLQYSCLENSMDRGSWWATVHGVTKIQIQYIHICVLCLATQLCPTLCDPIDCSLPGSSILGDSPGKSTGVGCHALLQGSPQSRDQTQVPRVLYHLNHQGSPRILEWVAYPFSRGSS